MRVAAEPAAIAAETAAVVEEPVRAVAEPAAIAADAAAVAEEPVRVVAEPVPVTGGVVAETAEPVPPTGEPVADAARPVPAAEPVAMPAEPVAVPAEPVAVTAQPVAVAAEPAPVAAPPPPGGADPASIAASSPPSVDEQTWPRHEVFELALEAYRCGALEGRFSRPLLSIIDYSLPASERRLWVIDLDAGRVLHHELVAHGEQSGGNLAVAFSNAMDSHQSSLGLFRTDEAYNGRFGYALRISGLEAGFNDNARARAIVFHAESDVTPAFIAQWGTIGRTWGCPALPPDVSAEVIDCIAGGSAVFAYYPDPQWLRESRYLHCGNQLAQASIAVR